MMKVTDFFFGLAGTFPFPVNDPRSMIEVREMMKRHASSDPDVGEAMRFHHWAFVDGSAHMWMLDYIAQNASPTAETAELQAVLQLLAYAVEVELVMALDAMTFFGRSYVQVAIMHKSFTPLVSVRVPGNAGAWLDQHGPSGLFDIWGGDADRKGSGARQLREQCRKLRGAYDKAADDRDPLEAAGDETSQLAQRILRESRLFR